MIKKAFKMKLFPGCEETYRQRHDQLWPEMVELLKTHGAKTYCIFFDSETSSLFGYLEIDNEEKWLQVAQTEINQKWWNYMADIMETNEDHSPVSVELTKVFNLE